MTSTTTTGVRGAKACKTCRALKIRCIGSDHPPCQKCRKKEQECVFEGFTPSGRYAVGSGSGSSGSIDHSSILVPGPGNTSTDYYGPAREHSSADRRRARTPYDRPENFAIASTSNLPQPPLDPNLYPLDQGTDLAIPSEADLAEFISQLNATGYDVSTFGQEHYGDVGSGSSGQDTTSTGTQAIASGSQASDSSSPNPTSDLFFQIVGRDRVEQLFERFFRDINPSLSLLSESYHTVDSVAAGSSFLLLTICTISAGTSPELSSLYTLLHDMVLPFATSYALRSPRNIETVQSFLLLALYVVHPFDGENQDDFGWTFVTVACRMALDLKLHRRHVCMYLQTLPADEIERQMANRLSTWLLCFSLDRSFSISRGRMSTLTSEHDEGLWLAGWRGKPLILLAYTRLMIMVGRSVNAIHRGQAEIAVVNAIVTGFERDVETWSSEVQANVLTNEHGVRLGQQSLWLAMIRSLAAYWSMVMTSFALEAASTGSDNVSMVFYASIIGRQALRVMSATRANVCKWRPLSHAPLMDFAYLAYAAMTLLKVYSRPIPFPPGSELSVGTCQEAILGLVEALEADRPAGATGTIHRVAIGLIVGSSGRAGLPLDRSNRSRLGDVLDARIDKMVAYLGNETRWRSLIVPGLDNRDHITTEDIMSEL